MSASVSLLAAWSTFYVMTGTSAATLIGLMFVVITLVTRAEQVTQSQEGLSTFSTPTVLHFSAALFVSAILSAPWRAVVYPGALIAVLGLFGVGNAVRIIFRTKRVTEYIPDLEDWLFYTIFPLLAYGAVFAGGIALVTHSDLLFFALAGGILLLIFIGIHNAWDIVTFLAVRTGKGSSE